MYNYVQQLHLLKLSSVGSFALSVDVAGQQCVLCLTRMLPAQAVQAPSALPFHNA